MNVIVIYDITDDKLRKQVSEELKNFGLERIGYSVFCGSISKKALYALEERLKILFSEDTAFGQSRSARKPRKFRSLAISPLPPLYFYFKILFWLFSQFKSYFFLFLIFISPCKNMLKRVMTYGIFRNLSFSCEKPSKRLCSKTSSEE